MGFRYVSIFSGVEAASLAWEPLGWEPVAFSEIGDKPAGVNPMLVRRLTPLECERLQGFPDEHTLIAWKGKPAEECPDGPRYKAIGNSMAVPVMRWIGRRIAAVDKN